MLRAEANFFSAYICLKSLLRFKGIITQPDCTYNTSIKIQEDTCGMIDYKTVGQRIRAVRLQKKLTQEKLAEAAGVGVTHISHIETGNSIPSLQVTVDIVNALGCSMDELLCMDVEQARSVRDNWLGELVADCSGEEVKLITDTVLALKDSLRRLKLTAR